MEENTELQVEQQPAEHKKDVLWHVAKVFFIIGVVFNAICTLGIALAWCLPMKRRTFSHVQNNEPLSVGLRVCTLIFVNTVAGILLLIRRNPVQD